MAVSRRDFLKASGLLALQARPDERGVVVNDIHSQLNPTRVPGRLHRICLYLQRALRRADSTGRRSAWPAASDAMGAQQFAEGSMMLDMTRFNHVGSFDRTLGIVEVEAGIMWPALVEDPLKAQEGRPALSGVEGPRPWGIVQKQTGADRLTIGGALSANVHGRGSQLKPFIGDVESFVLIDAQGNARNCSRTENTELFRLAIGGYGLFGAISTVKLRLADAPERSSASSRCAWSTTCRKRSSSA